MQGGRIAGHLLAVIPSAPCSKTEPPPTCAWLMAALGEASLARCMVALAGAAPWVEGRGEKGGFLVFACLMCSQKDGHLFQAGSRLK